MQTSHKNYQQYIIHLGDFAGHTCLHAVERRDPVIFVFEEVAEELEAGDHLIYLISVPFVSGASNLLNADPRSGQWRAYQVELDHVSWIRVERIGSTSTNWESWVWSCLIGSLISGDVSVDQLPQLIRRKRKLGQFCHR